MRPKTQQAVLAILVLTGLGVAFVVGWIGGSATKEYREFERKYLLERQLIEPVLRSDSAFSKIQIGKYTGGGIYITGEVENQIAYERLRNEFVRLFGETRASELTSGIYVLQNEKTKGTKK